jgi:Holliday junction resolvasome RuvABC endonuclease subunit
MNCELCGEKIVGVGRFINVDNGSVNVCNDVVACVKRQCAQSDGVANILGVDTGITHFGYGIVSADKFDRVTYVTSGNVNLKNPKAKKANETAFRAMENLYPLLNDLVQYYCIMGIALERIPTVPMGGRDALIAVQNFVRSYCIINGLKYYEANPSKSKDGVTGDKNASKEEVKQALGIKFPTLPMDIGGKGHPDAYDALAMATVAINDLKYEEGSWWR